MQMLGGYLLILAAVVICISAQNPPLILGGTIYDQAPNTMLLCGSAGTANGSAGFWGTDFEITLGTYTEHEYGLVGKECNATYGFFPPACGALGADLTPVYAYTGTSPGNNIKSPATFYNWFHPTAQNIPIPYNITLTYVANSGSSYTYINDLFFPITGRGWNDFCPNQGTPNVKENFSFCLVAHTRFGYTGNEVFNFAGDDDVWVYIDNRLVIDLGSLHQKTSRSLKVSTIAGLTPGNNYRFDFFYCERHTVESHMELTTSIQFFCAYYDWCGICEGNGQSCCNSTVLTTFCNDNNACTTDACPVTQNPTTNSSACTHTPITCPSSTCFPSICDPASGCLNTTLNCDDHNECTIDSCNPATGCSHLSCNGTASCPVGCTTRPYCDDGNPCTSDIITVTNGAQNCTNVLNGTICNDLNVCTNDYCDSSANTTASACYHTNITCTPTLCQISSGCDKVSGCIYQPVVCAGSSDYCQTFSCDSIAGCISLPRVCVVDDPYCYKGVCSNASSSCTQQKVSNFNIAVSKNGVLCVLRYDPTAQKAAIGTGAAVGIAIGAAAAMGIFGYGGKKGYDYIQTMRNQKFDGVQNNPLYEQTNGTGDNPLYRYSTTNPTA